MLQPFGFLDAAPTPIDIASGLTFDSLRPFSEFDPVSKNEKVDVAIIGGGLAGGLTAYFMAQAHPDRRILLAEATDRLGGNNTWSFFETDVSPAALDLLKPLISRSWSSASVEFPRLKRTLDNAYHSIASSDFNRILKEKLGDDRIWFDSRATKLTDTTVLFENGSSIDAAAVFDARGLAAIPPSGLNGYQKFIGYDVTLSAPHDLTAPILIDATCPQLDGFRFFYLLPWDQTRLLVEETFYSDTSELNEERISRSIKSYIERRGWTIKSIDREERGVIPVPLTAESITTGVAGEPVLLGSRAGFFHATTGFSLPDAVRFAEFLAKAPEITTQSARDSLAKFRRPWLSRQRFYRLMNRLLFQASEPALRYTILQKFYEHTDDVIQRFYGGRTTWTDRVRILSGKPPVPVSLALKNFSERSAIERIGSAK
jgi:lycopene beta-cyclase